MKLNNIFFLIFFSIIYPSLIVGTVEDENGNPIIYANVYLKDTFDGTSSDDKMVFFFS